MKALHASVVAGLLCFGATASADGGGISETLLKNTQELMDAVGAGNAAVWERHLDPRVIYVDESGTLLDKKTLVLGIKPLPKGVRGTLRVTKFQATVHRDIAVTTHVDDENEDFHGHKLHCQYRTTDTWKKTAEGWRLIASQVLALRTDPPAVAADPDSLEEYCGRYALTAELVYEIRCTEHGLVGQQTDGKPEELKMEAPDVFFVPGKPRYRKVFRRDDDGDVTGFAERREAWELLWERRPD